MLASLADRPVDDDGWLFEPKYDGIRLIGARDADTAAVWTRNGVDRSHSYPELVDALLDQASTRFVVDGEVVAFDGQRTSFQRLQQRSGIDDPERARHSGIAVYYYLFDLLHVDGHDLESVPLHRRKAALADVIDHHDPLRYSEHRATDGREYLEQACAMGWEGLIAKQADSRYVHGRSRSWVKLKCVRRQEVVIGGYTDPKGSRTALGSLLVGVHDGNELVYAGRVGTGFDEDRLIELQELLGRLRRPTSPFHRGNPAPGPVHWVAPELVCEVGFSEWTGAGRLRHPRFLGLRRDKDPREVVRDVPVPPARRGDAG